MASYISTTDRQLAEMLEAVGVSSIGQLFLGIPEGARLQAPLSLPYGASEMELRQEMHRMAAKNTVFTSVFRGAGSYRHYIPAIVSQILSKESLLTAYTPYQAEISQGVLQAIFEFQTMVCELTGMQAANASVYDGAWAAAEALGMCRDRRRNKALVSRALHPRHLSVVRTYAGATGIEMVEIPVKDGVTDAAALREMLDDAACAVLVPQVNFFGQIEDAAALAEDVHAAGAKLILSVHPVAAAVLTSAADCGADIAVGDGQPLGLPMGFGGPALGFMATSKAMARKLPGRIVGQTHDAQGRRAFVLTLQAREQHIRREKAASNICSNQALCALAAGAYLSAMGPQGLTRVARACMANAAYLRQQITSLPGCALRFSGPMFHEFVTACPVPPQQLMKKLEAHGILGGLSLSGELKGHILWCVTELNSRAEIDALIKILRAEVGVCV